MKLTILNNIINYILLKKMKSKHHNYYKNNIYNKMSIVEIFSVEQFESILDCENTYILVDFYATWCGPCKKIEPDIKKLCEDYKEVKFCKVDVDKVPALAKQYKISAMPTFLLFHTEASNTATYKRIVGADVTKITNLIKSTRVVICDNTLF
jgi:thioredoxin 1